MLLDKELSKGEAARAVVKLLYEFRTVAFVTVRTARPHTHAHPHSHRRPPTHSAPPAARPPPTAASPACALVRTPTRATRRSRRRAASSREYPRDYSLYASLHLQINTARYELSLARHLPAPVSGVPQLVAIKTTPSADGDKKKISIGAKAHRGEFAPAALQVSK